MSDVHLFVLFLVDGLKFFFVDLSTYLFIYLFFLLLFFIFLSILCSFVILLHVFSYKICALLIAAIFNGKTRSIK